jgi:hypothetical protein
MHSRCGPWQQPGTCWSLGRRAKLAVLDQPRWWTRYSSWRELLHPTKGNYIKQPRDLKMNVLGATQAAKVKIYQHLVGRVIPRSNPNFRPWPAKSAKHPGSLISCIYLWSIMIHHDPWWNRCCGTGSGEHRLQALRTLAPYFYLTSSQLRESRAPSWADPESLEEQPGFFWWEWLWSNYMYNIYIYMYIYMYIYIYCI